MNRKEKKALNLKMLTKRVERNMIDRRSFIKGAVALGLTASTAMLLYQGYEHGSNGVGTAFAQEGLVRRLWPLEEMALDTYDMWVRTEGKSIAYLPRLAAHPYHVQQDIVYRREAEEAGMDYSMFDSQLSAAVEVQNLELAIARGFDVIIDGPMDPASSSPPVKRARERGIIFESYESETLQRPTVRFGRIFYQEGVAIAKWMSENLPSGAKVVGGVGELSSNIGFDRKAGFVDGSAQFGLELLGFEDANGWIQEGGYVTGRAMLGRFPDIQGAFWGNDEAAIGFSRAASDLGRKDEIRVGGADGLREGQEAVADGRLDVSNMMVFGHGPEATLSMDYVLALLRANLHGDSMSGMHITPMIAVDRTNIDAQWKSPV